MVCDHGLGLPGSLGRPGSSRCVGSASRRHRHNRSRCRRQRSGRRTAALAPWPGDHSRIVQTGTTQPKQARQCSATRTYATLLPAFYVPLMTMLFAPVFRGTAFEFPLPCDPLPAGVGPSVQRRVAACDVLPGGGAGWLHQRHSDRRRGVSGRHPRFPQCVCCCLRSRSRCRIFAARRRVAHFQNNRKDRRVWPSGRAGCPPRYPALHRQGYRSGRPPPQSHFVRTSGVTGDSFFA